MQNVFITNLIWQFPKKSVRNWCIITKVKNEHYSSCLVTTIHSVASTGVSGKVSTVEGCKCFKVKFCPIGFYSYHNIDLQGIIHQQKFRSKLRYTFLSPYMIINLLNCFTLSVKHVIWPFSISIIWAQKKHIQKVQN